MMTIMMMMMIMTDPFTTNLVVKGAVVKGSVVKGAHPVQVIILTCNRGEEDADEDGPGGVDVDDDQVPLVPPAEVPLSLILVV